MRAEVDLNTYSMSYAATPFLPTSNSWPPTYSAIAGHAAGQKHGLVRQPLPTTAQSYSAEIENKNEIEGPDWGVSKLFVAFCDPKPALVNKIILHLHDHNRTDTFLESAQEALSFLSFIRPDKPLPDLSFAEDGEIVFSWEHEGAYLEVSFYGDGHIYYYISIPKISKNITGQEAFYGRSISKLLSSSIDAI